MRSFLVATLAILLLSAPAAAENDAKWGAIAYSNGNGPSGTAVNYDSAVDARVAAIEACAGRCTQTFVFQRNCGAVAVSASGRTAAMRNRWRGRAIAGALSQCRRGGAECTLVAAACVVPP